MSMKVGFIGLGHMGSGMAWNIIKNGHTVTVYNRTKSRTEEFRSAGVPVASTPGEAASSADVVITMLSDDKAVHDVVFDRDGVLAALPSGAVHVAMSTISVALSRDLASAHRDKGQHYVGAPVFGRPDAATAAKLFVVAAGAKEQVERCQPLFDAVGQKTFVVNEEPSLANVVKLTGNFLITVVIESMAESFAVVQKAGLDRATFLEVMTSSLFTAPVYKNYGSIIANEKYDPPGFKMPLGLKDNRLMMQLAEESSVPMPMASLIHDRFLAAMAQGLEEADWSAIAKISMRSAGLER
jgi:3-hydroxyisobutyrate dehydrogenase-like beta-hydroxyacid dehydrogenase